MPALITFHTHWCCAARVAVQRLKPQVRRGASPVGSVLWSAPAAASIAIALVELHRVQEAVRPELPVGLRPQRAMRPLAPRPPCSTTRCCPSPVCSMPRPVALCALALALLAGAAAGDPGAAAPPPPPHMVQITCQRPRVEAGKSSLAVRPGHGDLFSVFFHTAPCPLPLHALQAPTTAKASSCNGSSRVRRMLWRLSSWLG